MRLYFGNSPSVSASLRATARTLEKLRKIGLIEPLKRRIGGVRAGSTSYVWTLKTAGCELLEISNNATAKPKNPRKIVFELTYIFLKHTFEVAELYTKLISTKSLINAEFEPNCWHHYTADFRVNSRVKSRFSRHYKIQKI